MFCRTVLGPRPGRGKGKGERGGEKGKEVGRDGGVDGEEAVRKGERASEG
jgi:hypothetical protein